MILSLIVLNATWKKHKQNNKSTTGRWNMRLANQKNRFSLLINSNCCKCAAKIAEMSFYLFSRSALHIRCCRIDAALLRTCLLSFLLRELGIVTLWGFRCSIMFLEKYIRILLRISSTMSKKIKKHLQFFLNNKFYFYRKYWTDSTRCASLKSDVKL